MLDIGKTILFSILHLSWNIISNEITRIIRKGSQVLIGYSLVFIFFFCISNLVYPLYCLNQSHNIIVLLVIVSPIIVVLTTLLINLIMNHIYTSKYLYCEQYRIMNQPWPWEVDENKYKKQYREIIINSIEGSVIVSPILMCSLIYFNLLEYITDPISYPSSLNNLKDIILLSTVYECFAYWFHRLFHTPWLYKKFHKQHHEYKVTVSITAFYNDPFDFLMSIWLPGIIARLSRGKLHIITEFIWMFYSNVYGSLSHCGYNFPWFPWSCFPFGAEIKCHDYHHSRNVGNYGTFSTFWDTVCGTNADYLRSIKRETAKSK